MRSSNLRLGTYERSHRLTSGGRSTPRIQGVLLSTHRGISSDHSPGPDGGRLDHPPDGPVHAPRPRAQRRPQGSDRGRARGILSAQCTSTQCAPVARSRSTSSPCGGGLLQTDPQERAKTSTATSDCRPRPAAPDPGLSHGNSQEQATLGPTNAGEATGTPHRSCLLYTSPSPRDATLSRMPSSA